MKRNLAILFAFLIFIAACKDDKITETATPLPFEGFKKPAHFPEPAYNLASNPVTKEGFELGRKLFYDGILSRDGSISCGSCHIQYSAFTQHGHNVSHGIDDRLGTRNSPPTQNLAWSTSFFWDGGVFNLDLFSMSPIENPVEMDEKLPHVISKLNNHPLYPALFEKAFGSREVTGANLMKALSQFMLMLVSADSRYDKYMQGDTSVLSATEKKGMQLFMANCNTCHTAPLFTDNKFHNNGLLQTADKGRSIITLNPEDQYKFKTPSLRNAEKTTPYMHDGRFETLEEVLKHYHSGVRPSATLDPLLTNGIRLSTEEQEQVVAFLKTLTDSKFITDKRFSE